MIPDTFDLDGFIDIMETKTLNNELEWNLVDNVLKKRYLARSNQYESIKNIYTNTNNNGDIVAIGCFDYRVYIDSDEYYFDDRYFISFSNPRHTEVITFINDVDLPTDFQIKLGKLYRIIQIQSSGLANKINNWFD